MEGQEKHRRDTIVVVDLGGQYAHLITNCVRKLGVYAETVNPESPLNAYALPHVKGIILSGGPASIYGPDRPPFPAQDFFREIAKIAKPVLGICYGHQLMADEFGGEECAPVGYREDEGEYGVVDLTVVEARGILEGLSSKEQVLMSHRDRVDITPPGFRITARTRYTPCAAMEHEDLPFFGVQFHPEVVDTPCGVRVLDNFLNICRAERSWTADEMRKDILANTRAQVGDKSVLLLYSGGADSSVTLSVLQYTVPLDRLHVAIIDTGLLRKGEAQEIRKRLALWMREDINRQHLFPSVRDLKHLELDAWLAGNVRIIRAEKQFLEALRDVYDPEEKRLRISDCFARVARKALRNAARGRGGVKQWLLAQGTIYPDTIESGSTTHAAHIKTHHNIGVAGSIIQKMRARGRLLEPLIPLYKDDVRLLGKELGVPRFITERQPFPGPGLAVRVLCSAHNIWLPEDDLVRKAISAEYYIDLIARRYGLKAAILSLKSVGVQGDQRSYALTAALEGEAEWDTLLAVSQTITNTYRGVINRVVWRLSPPPRVALQDLVLAKAFVTKKRAALLQEADDIVTRILRAANWHDQMWQFPVVLAPLGYVRGGESIILRPVNSVNAMTATVHRLPPVLLERMVGALLRLPCIHEVFYDLTGKPPGTIEWE